MPLVRNLQKKIYLKGLLTFGISPVSIGLMDEWLV